MNIEQSIRNLAWSHYDDPAILNRDVQAVLAEVAKHNTPDKPAFYKTSERKPTAEDAGLRGQVLHWWSNKYWAAIHFENVTEDDLWMPMPPAPISEDEAAFQTFLDSAYGKVRLQANEDSCRKVWDAALAHRDKSKP